jgi:pimeloyl-ACP methyl ester carboxylesterase
MFIELNGVNHHYVSRGEGPPVVFVHGLGGSLHYWHGVMENLTAHHHCVALDLRGHGRSDVTKGQLSIETWTQDVEALLSALELPPVTLVGHSGSTGTWLFHCPELDVVLAGTVDQARGHQTPFRLMPRLIAAVHGALR